MIDPNPLAVEEGYRRAAFQRPGVIIRMGATAACEARIPPAPYRRDMQGFSSWAEYDRQFN